MVMAADLDKVQARNLHGGRAGGAMDVSIGASGAATVDYADHSSFAIVKNTTGVYDMTFPISKRTRLVCNLISPSLTVTHYALTAFDASLGTATIKTLKNDAAAEPASGDKLQFLFEFDHEVF